MGTHDFGRQLSGSRLSVFFGGKELSEPLSGVSGVLQNHVIQTQMEQDGRDDPEIESGAFAAVASTRLGGTAFQQLLPT